MDTRGCWGGRGWTDNQEVTGDFRGWQMYGSFQLWKRKFQVPWIPLLGQIRLIWRPWVFCMTQLGGRYMINAFCITHWTITKVSFTIWKCFFKKSTNIHRPQDIMLTATETSHCLRKEECLINWNLIIQAQIGSYEKLDSDCKSRGMLNLRSKRQAMQIHAGLSWREGTELFWA